MIRNLTLMIFILSTTVMTRAQEVEVMDFGQLQSHIEAPSDKIKVYNYWATFCRPCIKEMPYFEEFALAYKDNIEMYFVTLDFIEDLDKKVKPFLQKKGITSKVILLNDIDYNSWINKVNPNWSGAIPATDFVVPGSEERIFYEGGYEKEELRNQIESLINKI